MLFFLAIQRLLRQACYFVTNLYSVDVELQLAVPFDGRRLRFGEAFEAFPYVGKGEVEACAEEPCGTNLSGGVSEHVEEGA